MSFHMSFLPVGNADCIALRIPEADPIIIDLPNARRAKEWLERVHAHKIEAIYITHAHRDHFQPIETFVAFIAGWLRAGTVSKVFLPRNALRDAYVRLKGLAESDIRYKRLKDALARINQWYKDKILIVSGIDRDVPALQLSSLSIRALHPNYIFSESHEASTGSNHLNETSLVLKVTYGHFGALLTGDLDGKGAREVLEVCSPEELSAHVIKLPHHGAMPASLEVFKSLLNLVNAELAVISAGSKNPHGHVAPEVFSTLLSFQADQSRRLRKFVCTEVTRTCINSSKERAAMGKTGLSVRRLCAGEITVHAEASGSWTLETETPHAEIVNEVERAACEGRADLDGEK